MSDAAYEHLDALSKPVGALGLLEDWAARLRDLLYPAPPSITSPSLAIFCADHGVAHAQRTSRYPAHLTPFIALQLACGRAGASVISSSVGVDASLRRVVDVGMASSSPIDSAGGVSTVTSGPRVRAGTADFTTEPAMTQYECEMAEAVGARTIASLCEAGSNCVALGEVGIGNTAVSSALLSAFTGQPPSATCGAGSGLDKEGIQHKVRVVEKAMHLHAAVVNEYEAAPRAVLAALGGLEIAALVGAMHEADRLGIAVIVDGFICSTAALAALRIRPSCARCIFLATASPEKGHQICLDAIAGYVWPDTGRPRYSHSPVPLNMGLRLGEGTGSLLCVPIIRAAADVYNKMGTLSETGG